MLMTSKPWALALHVPQSTYNSWAKQCPKDESVLLWSLSTNQISSDDYFLWAREHYGLAHLNSEFFERAADKSLWQKIKTAINWSAEMIPVLEWDGVIFIACIEPQPEISWSFPVQFVLANANDLKKYWNELHNDLHNELHIAAAPIHFDPPEGMGAINTVATPEENNPPEGIEAPVGLSVPGDFKLNLNLTVPEGLNPPEGAITSVIQIKQASNIPDGLNINPSVHAMDPQSNYVNFLYKAENDFQGGMILSVADEQLKAIAWNSKFKPINAKAEAFWSLNQPSAFRVAYRTKLPYLGHVVDTPINREFFNSWGMEHLPERILVQPVKATPQNNITSTSHNAPPITHLILLITNTEKQNHAILSLAEKLSIEFNQLLFSITKAA